MKVINSSPLLSLVLYYVLQVRLRIQCHTEGKVLTRHLSTPEANIQYLPFFRTIFLPSIQQYINLLSNHLVTQL